MPKKPFEKIFIALPAYNEERVIAETIEEIRSHGYKHIVIADDGSTDNTFEKAKETGVHTVKHKINRGKGAATKTAMEASYLLGADIVVTLDSDGQHDPKDIKEIIKPILKRKCDVVLGSRLINPEGMPKYKILHNQLGNTLTWMLYGLWVTDSQSGFRAYSRKAIEFIDTRGDRYEFESEIIQEISRHKLRFEEVPIQVRYTDYSMNKPVKQSLGNGIKTAYKLLLKKVL
jgi:glycosyltransferase involved in cell wall biosynthesis